MIVYPRSGPDFGVVLQRENADWADVYAVGDAVAAQSFPSVELQDAVHLGGTRVGILCSTLVAEPGPMRLNLRVLDAEADVSESQAWPLTEDSAFSDAVSNAVTARATLIGDGGPDANHVAFVGRYESSAGVRIFFGRSEGSPAPIGALSTDAKLSADELEVRALVRNGTTNYAFLGVPGSGLGPRELVFEDDLAKPAVSHELGAANTALADVSQPAGGTINVGMGTIGSPVTVRTGRLDFDRLASVEIGDLELAASFDSLSALPLANNPRWLGDMLVLVGARIDDATQLAVLMVDAFGHFRVRQDMPFTGTIVSGITRSIASAAAIPRLPFDTAGGDVQVVWIELHMPAGGADETGYHVLYSDVLSCSVAP
jgi:hypothetical protein